MARGKRAKPTRGTLEGDWEPFQFQEELFRVGRGESRPQPSHGYPILEMMRYAKYAFDKKRHLIPPGNVKEFEERLQEKIQIAALVEMQYQAELRLLDRLFSRNCISNSDYSFNISEIKKWHEGQVSDAANGAAVWLAQIQYAIEPRGRGRPSNKLLPNETDTNDWRLIMTLDSICGAPTESKSRQQQCLELVPAAVRQACAAGIYKPSDDSEAVATGKQYEAHVKRISSKIKKWVKD